MLETIASNILLLSTLNNDNLQGRASIVATSVWEWGTNKLNGSAQSIYDSPGSSSSSSSSSSSPSSSSMNKSLATVMFSDLRAALSSKPSGTSIQAVAGSFLRGGVSGVRSMSASADYVKWSMQTERVVRDTLLLFFSYLFYDIDELMLRKSAALRSSLNRGSSSKMRRSGGAHIEEPFSPGDSRSAFDLDEYIRRRQLMNDTPAVQNFVNVFVHSQMFERFCDRRLKKCMLRDGERVCGIDHDENDEYDRVCDEIKRKQVWFNL